MELLLSPFPENGHYLTCLVQSWKVPLPRMSFYLNQSSANVNSFFLGAFVENNQRPLLSITLLKVVGNRTDNR